MPRATWDGLRQQVATLVGSGCRACPSRDRTSAGSAAWRPTTSFTSGGCNSRVHAFLPDPQVVGEPAARAVALRRADVREPSGRGSGSATGCFRTCTRWPTRRPKTARPWCGRCGGLFAVPAGLLRLCRRTRRLALRESRVPQQRTTSSCWETHCSSLPSPSPAREAARSSCRRGAGGACGQRTAARWGRRTAGRWGRRPATWWVGMTGESSEATPEGW